MENKKECPYRKELDFSLWCKRTCRYCTLEQRKTCNVKKEAIKITNADRIRSMTDEELAKFLEEITCESHGWCDECKSLKGDYCHGLNDESNSLVQERLEWLKSEVGCE